MMKSSRDKILNSEAALEAWLAEVKLKGEKIVFTNGCFDLLHPGHLSYLAEAQSLGDHLIVAVNTDASVKKLKGEDRPINNLKDRMLMLASLIYVDKLIAFDEETPYELIKEICPAQLVKGGDYAEDQIVGADLVKSNGGKVSVLPFLSGYSSTAIIQKISDLK